MNKKFSLAYLTLPDTQPVDQIEIASLCGYDGVGLRNLSGNWPADKKYALADEALFTQVKDALARTGVELMDIELGRVLDGVDVASYEEEFAKGAELGAKYVTASIWTQDTGYAKEQLTKMSDLAAKYGLTLSMEFVPFAAMATLADVLEWIRKANCPNIKILVDLLHAYRTHVTPAQLATIDPDLFGCIHLCDGPAFIPPLDHPDMKGVTREARLYMGEGGMDILPILQAIPNPPYYAIELPNLKAMDTLGKLGHARKSLETTKAYFQKYKL